MTPSICKARSLQGMFAALIELVLRHNITQSEDAGSGRRCVEVGTKRAPGAASAEQRSGEWIARFWVGREA